MSRNRGRGETVEELLARLALDPKYQKAAVTRQADREALERHLNEVEAPIARDLRSVGIKVQSAWDLVPVETPYPAALSILLTHLEEGSYPDRVREGLARALAVPDANVYWDRLRRLYLNSSDGPDARQGLAVALAASAVSANLEDLIALLGTDDLGPSRLHLVRAIMRVGDARGRSVVESLRSHPFFGKEAKRVIGRKA